MLLGIPLWVVLVTLLIFLSGYMAFKTMQEEREQDQQFIEREGKVYIDRMKEEKQIREQRRQRSN
ncbi:sporulation YhaL family protein [Lentibacillus sediminis]|uniref:sporulation YhaL family protein n=1 Tax=Lentibacillus sediminis TaxID=1940529 RepID=UPI000C1C48F8|nr:sporulation YhaL family protein [Lentibacillus sediminis]